MELSFQNFDLKSFFQIIEDILPAWVVIINFDKYENISMKTKNKLFCKEFEIKEMENDDMNFRKLIRNLEVYPYEENCQKEALTEKQRKESGKNFEKKIIQCLKQGQVSDSINQKGEKFIALKKDEQSTLVKKLQISLVKFYAEEPLVMLLFEEMSQTKLEEYQNEIAWRDNFYATLLSKSIKSTASVIAFMKTVRQFIRIKLKHQVDRQKKILNLVDDQIIKSFITHNIMLNAKTLTDIAQQQLKFSISTINLNTFLLRFKQNFRVNIVQKMVNQPQKIKQQKSFLKRATDRNQTQQSSNIIKNDFQKITQVIISIIEFIILLLQMEDENIDNATEGISIQFKIPKKIQQAVSISLYHSKLRIPPDLVDLLTKNWAQSDLNTSRWLMQQHTQLIRLIQTKIDENIQRYTDQDQCLFSPKQADTIIQKSVKLKELFCQTNLALAQYIVSQIGPQNIFLINHKNMSKNKNGEQQNNNLVQFEELSVEKDYNKISFHVYLDLNEEIERINYNNNFLISSDDEKKQLLQPQVARNLPSQKSNQTRILSNQPYSIRQFETNRSTFSPNIQQKKFEFVKS